MRNFFIFQVCILLVMGVAWVVNFVKLTDCDFEPSYRCEAIHGAGIIPPVAVVTAWFGTDAKP